MSDDKKTPEQDAPETTELKQEELEKVHGGALLEFQIPEKLIQKFEGGDALGVKEPSRK
ncbi:MAG TPA: hypothetical protein PKW63_00240 [Vicinamibacterales bacterium]|nr:hypothetical protein [Vicinamibacterales bacterium]